MFLFAPRLWVLSLALVLGMGSIQQPILATNNAPTSYYATRTGSPTLVQRQKLDTSLRDIISTDFPKFSLRTAGLSMLFIFSMQNLGVFANYYFFKARNKLYPSVYPTNLVSVHKSMIIIFSLFVSIIEELAYQKLAQNFFIFLFKKPSIGISLASVLFAWAGPMSSPAHRIDRCLEGLAFGYDYFWTKDLRYAILGRTLWYLCKSNLILTKEQMAAPGRAKKYGFFPDPIINLLLYANSGWCMPIWALIAVFSGNELYAQYQQNQGVHYESLFQHLRAKC